MKIIILPEASGKSPPDLSRFVNHVLFWNADRPPVSLDFENDAGKVSMQKKPLSQETQGRHHHPKPSTEMQKLLWLLSKSLMVFDNAAFSFFWE